MSLRSLKCHDTWLQFKGLVARGVCETGTVPQGNKCCLNPAVTDRVPKQVINELPLLRSMLISLSLSLALAHTCSSS